ncbi:MAG: hypothetical protein PUB04_08340 [Clostridia bacterium]|nr:hypothetical protein [Clostridia bacterium]
MRKTAGVIVGKTARIVGMAVAIMLVFNICGCAENKEDTDNKKNADNSIVEITDTTFEITEVSRDTDKNITAETITSSENSETEAIKNTEAIKTTETIKTTEGAENAENSKYSEVIKNTEGNENNSEGITIMELYELLGCRINDNGYLYTDNTESAVNSGIAMAESMEDFYKIVEQAVLSRKDSVDILLNIYSLDVDKYGIYREVHASEAQKEDGSYYYFEDRWVGDERPFADYERVINNTGVNVLWVPGYNQSLFTDIKYVYFEVEFTYLADKLYFAYSKEEVTTKINQAISNGESRFNICRYFTTEDPDTVEYSQDCRPYLYNLAQKSSEPYYDGCHILNVDYSNDEMIVLSNDGMSSGCPLWNELRFSYEPYGYDGYENCGCVAYLTVDVRNVKDDLELREGLTRIDSIEQLTEIRNSYNYDSTVHWLGYFKGSQDEAFEMHTQMVLKGTPVAYERVADGWYYFYW